MTSEAQWPEAECPPPLGGLLEMCRDMEALFKACRRRGHVVVSGHFQGLHLGHFLYLEAAASLGDRLTVIVNSDAQAVLKKGFSLFGQRDRMEMVRRIKGVDAVWPSVDDDLSVRRTLEMIHESDPVDVFANGGDVKDGCREEEVCRRLGVACVYGVGGDKVDSSSRLLVTLAANSKAGPAG